MTASPQGNQLLGTTFGCVGGAAVCEERTWAVAGRVALVYSDRPRLDWNAP